MKEIYVQVPLSTGVAVLKNTCVNVCTQLLEL